MGESQKIHTTNGYFKSLRRIAIQFLWIAVQTCAAKQSKPTLQYVLEEGETNRNGTKRENSNIRATWK